MNGDFGGCRGDGGTDCHSQCAHWLRNDRFYKGCVGRAVGDAGPYGGLQGVQWAGDRKGRPYESVTWGAVQNRRAG